MEAAAGDGTVRLVVRDTGIGIDPAFLPHVFDRFRQADGSMSRRHGGLGIGLAIVQHLTELHGGCVAAESAGPGCGASFTITLPRAPAVPSLAPFRPADGSDHRPAGTDAAILVAHDEPDAA